MIAVGAQGARTNNQRWAAMLLGAALAASGCARPISASTHTLNPLVAKEAGLDKDVSFDVVIRIKDLNQPEGLAHETTMAGVYPDGRGQLLPGYVQPRYFDQTAVIQYANADEIHVAVQLTSEWRELVQIGHYQAELVDDRGQSVGVIDRWDTSDSHRDYQATYQALKNYQTVRIQESTGVRSTYNMWAPEQYYVAERLYRGRGTLVFRRPNLLSRDTRSLTMVLRSSSRTLRFTWYFEPLEKAG